MKEELPTLEPPERLLCGPGPTNVEPSVLDAMRKPMLGHLDPDLHDILLDVVDMLRRAWRMPDGLVLPLHCTGTAGMEAGLANLLEPGDTAIVARSGYFGRRIAEIAAALRRRGDRGQRGLGRGRPERAHPAGARPPPAGAPCGRGARRDLDRASSTRSRELGEALRERDALLMADCVTSLGGVELDADAWGIDYAYSCTQKCLAAPPGMSPVAVSEARSRADPGAADAGPVLVRPAPARALLDRAAAGVPPHGAVLHIYALHEALRLLARGGPRDALGTARRGRRPPPAASSRRGASSCWRTPSTGSRRSPP